MKHYALIKFFVANYEVGEPASIDEIEYISGIGWRNRWTNADNFESKISETETAVVDFKAIIGIETFDISNGEPFDNEVSMIGIDELMEGNEDALDEIADTAIPGEPQEIVTLWSLYYDEYTDLESWYPEYDLVVEYHGIVTAELMGKLEKMLMGVEQ